jgi:hypothetical protein
MAVFLLSLRAVTRRTGVSIPYREKTHFHSTKVNYRPCGPVTPSSIETAAAFQAQKDGWGLKLRKCGAAPSILIFSLAGT